MGRRALSAVDDARSKDQTYANTTDTLADHVVQKASGRTQHTGSTDDDREAARLDCPRSSEVVANHAGQRTAERDEQ